MATSFSDLHSGVRHILGDTDPIVKVYSNDVIDEHIRLVILFENDATLLENGSTKEFTTTLSGTQKAIVILKSAQSIVAPTPDEFSYKSPVLSVRRKGAMSRLWSYLDGQIRELEGGSFPVESEGELAAYLNGLSRFSDEQDDALD